MKNIAGDLQLNMIIFLKNFDSLDEFRDTFIAQQAAGTANHQQPFAFSKTRFRADRLECIVIDARTGYQRRVFC